MELEIQQERKHFLWNKHFGRDAKRKKELRTKYNNQYQEKRSKMTEEEIKNLNALANVRLKKRRKTIRNAKGVRGRKLRLKCKMDKKRYNATYYRKKQLETPRGKFTRMVKLLDSIDFTEIMRILTPREGFNSSVDAEVFICKSNFMEYIEIYRSSKFAFIRTAFDDSTEDLNLVHVKISGEDIVIPASNESAMSYSFAGIILYENGIIYHNNPCWDDNIRFKYIGRKRRLQTKDPVEYALKTCINMQKDSSNPEESKDETEEGYDQNMMIFEEALVEVASSERAEFS